MLEAETRLVCSPPQSDGIRCGKCLKIQQTRLSMGELIKWQKFNQAVNRKTFLRCIVQSVFKTSHLRWRRGSRLRSGIPLTCRDEVHILADGVKQQPLEADSQRQTNKKMTRCPPSTTWSPSADEWNSFSTSILLHVDHRGFLLYVIMILSVRAFKLSVTVQGDNTSGWTGFGETEKTIRKLSWRQRRGLHTSETWCLKT